MAFPDSLRFTFICASIFLILILSLLSAYMYKKDNEYKVEIVRPIILGIFAIFSYSLFLLAETHTLALLFDSIYFIATDWLAMFVMLFVVAYTGIGKKYQNKIFVVFTVLCGVDTASLILNNFISNMFDLVKMTSASGLIYWGNNLKFFHFIHLGLCYIMVGTSFIMLIESTMTAASVCKIKYASILAVYVVVIIVNFVCYTLNVPFDVSVFFYGILAGFVCYYSTYTYPHKLLLSSLKAVNDTVSDAIMYFDEKGSCVYSNKRAHELFGTDEVFEPYLAEAYREKWEGQVKEGSNLVVGEDCFRNNGREHHFAIEYRKEFYGIQRLGSYLKLMDITEDFVNYRKERFVATHDIFTGVLNRIGFFDAVDALINEKGTFGYVMLVSNIRDFKLINEMFGEKIGDEIILKQAGILKTFSHAETIYGRISDDKFALYTRRDYFKEAEFREYIKLMQKVMERPLYQLRIVVGIYQPKGRIESAQSMYDKCLFATTQIANKYNEVFAYYDSILMDKLVNEKAIRTDFESAIINNQIEVFLQPIVDIDGNHCGAEALSRWHHPERGFLLPEEFLNILEKTGLIFQLDEFVWEESAKLLQKWSAAGINDKFISVNVSVKDFFYADIYKVFTQLVERYGIQPQYLHIEITELVLMSDFARADALSTKLQEAGFNVIIDNFGSGYSSLNMLKDVNTAGLKIGMNLLQSSVEINRNRIILETIISMADKLGMNVISEGVETEDQYKLLKECKCRYFQGNYIDTPKTVQEYEEMLKNNK